MAPLQLLGRLAAGCSLALASLTVATPAHADFDLQVTWPVETDINPTVDTYTITVTDSGPGDLFAVWADPSWGDLSQAIPHTGTVDLSLRRDGAGHFEIRRCLDSCVAVAVSPELSVHANLGFSRGNFPGTTSSPGAWSFPVSVVSFPGLTNVTYDWSLRNFSDVELSSGSASLGPSGTLTVEAPSGLTDGGYWLIITAYGEFSGGPVVSREDWALAYIDATAPEIWRKRLSNSVLFPVTDEYYDWITLTLERSEPGYLTVDIVSDGGAFVGNLVNNDYGEDRAEWDGRIDGSPVAPGLYRFRISLTDSAGNEAKALTQAFRVDLGEYKEVTSRSVLPAAKVIYNKYVGRCSSLVSPSSHRWRDSLGYYSGTKCKTQKGSAGVVVAQHAWWLPFGTRAFNYHRIQVEQYGGPAKGHAKGSYMVMGYITKQGKFDERVQFNGGLGWHSAKTVKRDLGRWLHVQDGRPYFVWSNGLTAGSRYDIKAFRLTVNGMVIVEPDGTWVAPRSRTTPGKAPRSTDALGPAVGPASAR
ncbi:MAG: hypothetical protein U0R80_16375 [Nocardioidaceae bacterium]